jgi:hypothetical protein
MELTERQQGYIDGLRALADHLEKTPELIGPSGTLNVNIYASDRDQFVTASRALGGTREKDGDSLFFNVTRQFGPHKVTVFTDREKVCRKIVVGHETIPAREEQIVEVVEWVCDDALVSTLPQAEVGG